MPVTAALPPSVMPQAPALSGRVSDRQAGPRRNRRGPVPESGTVSLPTRPLADARPIFPLTGNYLPPHRSTPFTVGQASVSFRGASGEDRAHPALDFGSRGSGQPQHLGQSRRLQP